MIKIKTPGGSLAGATVNVPFGDALCLGMVENVRLLGLSGSRMDAGKFEMWAGVAPERVISDLRVAGPGVERAPATGGTLAAVSDSASDTAGGVGAGAVLIVYIEAGTFFERFAFVTMNGATPSPAIQGHIVNGAPVPIPGPVFVNDAIRVNRAIVLEAGPGNPIGSSNLGLLELTISGVVQHAISPGATVALGQFATVPRGQHACITHANIGTVSGASGVKLSLQIQIWSFAYGGLVRATPQVTAQVQLFPNGALSIPFRFSNVFPPMSDIRFLVDNPGPAREVSADVTVYFVDDPDDPDPSPELQPMRIGL